MKQFYVALETKSQAFLLERRMEIAGVTSEMSFLPRDIMNDLCNMGLKIQPCHMDEAMEVLRMCGLPGFKVYEEQIFPNHSEYRELER